MDEFTHGMKTSAGMMLSKFLRRIATEQTEVEGNDPQTGKVRVITKAEALARVMWKLALGWEEKTEEVDKETGHKKVTTKQHKPEQAMISLIWDRMEGKVTSPENDKGKRQPLSEKVDEQTRQRVNALAGDR
jgi:hypothetical protein